MMQKDEGRRMKDEKRRAGRARALVTLLCSAFILHPSSLLASTQAEVLKSINENVGKEVDPRMLLAVFLSIVGLIVVVAIVNHRRKRVIVPKVLNHPGKLVKQVAKAVDLKPSDLKQLKAIAEARELSSPLLLLLCPSLLRKEQEKK
jgi:hypothetical protein